MKRFLSIERTVKFVSTPLKKKAKELLRCMIRVIQKVIVHCEWYCLRHV